MDTGGTHLSSGAIIILKASGRKFSSCGEKCISKLVSYEIILLFFLNREVWKWKLIQYKFMAWSTNGEHIMTDCAFSH